MRRGSNVQLVTPEAVVLEFDTAGIGSRMVALLLDLLVQVAILLAFVFAFSVIGGAGSFASGDAGTAVAVIFVFAAFSARLLYPSVLEATWRGRTLGKAAMGLRVVTTEGAPARFRHTIIRAALGLVEFELTGGAAAFFTALFSRRNQRLGDMAAGTIVVRERTGAAAPTATWFAVPPGCDAYVASLDLSGLGVAEHSAVRSFLLRAHTLAPGPRARLAVQLASPLADRLRHSPPDWVGPELFLACIAAAWQQRSLASAGSEPASPGWPAQPAPPASAPQRPTGPPTERPTGPPIESPPKQPTEGGGFAPPT